MSTHTVLQFSPSKSILRLATTPPQRKIQPSPEKRCLPCTTVIVPREWAGAAAEASSPVKKKPGKDNSVLDAQFEIQLGQPNQGLMESLTVSKRVELSYSLVENGKPTTPPYGDFSELLRLFPTAFAAEVAPPYVIIRVRTLPPKPWPFTVGGLLLWLTTDELEHCFDPGKVGKGKKMLEHVDLQRKEEFSESILKEAIVIFQALQIKIRDIMWSPGFWRITVPDGTDWKVLPSWIAHQVCFYKSQSEGLDPDPSVLGSKIPQGVKYDDTLYTTTPDALLRPGIMVSSSIRQITRDGKTEETFKTTTSGMLVVNHHGQPFITVASHGFEDDGLVYHPDPIKGSVIGKVVDRLPETDISIVKLNSGLRYVNETFSSKDGLGGIQMSGISPGYPPNLRVYDPITMDNPFSGFCEGLVLGIGAMLREEGDRDYIHHQWFVFENGSEPIDGSCGSPFLDSDGKVVGLFRFKKINSNQCWGVSAMELRNFGAFDVYIKDTFTSTLELLGNPKGYSAMALSVGITCGIATQLLLDGLPALNIPGILAPYKEEICDPIRKIAEREGIKMVEKVL